MYKCITYTAKRMDVKPDSRQCTVIITNPSQGMYQEIQPYPAMKIDSNKFNPSLAMMREYIFCHSL